MAKDAKIKKENKHFFKDFKAELKRVIWPTPKQLVNNTVAVVTIVLITAIIVFALDVVFEKMNTYGINKIKEAVNSSNTTVNELVDETLTEENNGETVNAEQNEEVATTEDIQTEEDVNE